MGLESWIVATGGVAMREWLSCTNASTFMSRRVPQNRHVLGMRMRAGVDKKKRFHRHEEESETYSVDASLPAWSMRISGPPNKDGERMEGEVRKLAMTKENTITFIIGGGGARRGQLVRR